MSIVNLLETALVFFLVIAAQIESLDAVEWERCTRWQPDTFCLAIGRSSVANGTATAGNGCFMTRDCLAMIIAVRSGAAITDVALINWKIYDARNVFVDTRAKSSKVIWFMNHFVNQGINTEGKRSFRSDSKLIHLAERITDAEDGSPRRFCEYVEDGNVIRPCGKQNNMPRFSYEYQWDGIDPQDDKYYVGIFNSSITLFESLTINRPIPPAYQLNMAWPLYPHLYREEWNSELVGANSEGRDVRSGLIKTSIANFRSRIKIIDNMYTVGAPYNKCFEDRSNTFCLGLRQAPGGATDTTCVQALFCHVVIIGELFKDSMGQETIDWDVYVIANRLRRADNVSTTNLETTFWASNTVVTSRPLEDPTSGAVLAKIRFPQPEGPPSFCSLVGSLPEVCLPATNAVYEHQGNDFLFETSAALNYWRIQFKSPAIVAYMDGAHDGGSVDFRQPFHAYMQRNWFTDRTLQRLRSETPGMARALVAASRGGSPPTIPTDPTTVPTMTPITVSPTNDQETVTIPTINPTPSSQNPQPVPPRITTTPRPPPPRPTPTRTTTTTQRIQPQNQDGPNLGLIVGLIAALLVLLALCAGAYCLTRKSNSSPRHRVTPRERYIQRHSPMKTSPRGALQTVQVQQEMPVVSPLTTQEIVDQNSNDPEVEDFKEDMAEAMPTANLGQLAADEESAGSVRSKLGDLYI